MSTKIYFPGRIARADSIFKYTDGSNFETFDKRDFEPLFLQEVLDKMTDDEKQKAQDTCKGNNECIFDYVVTGEYDVICVDNRPLVKNIESIVCSYNGHTCKHQHM